MPTPHRRGVLLVRRDWWALQSFRRNLRAVRPDWTIQCSSRAEGALALIAAGGVDAVVTEVELAGLGGLALLETCRAQYPWIRRLVCSPQLTIDDERRALHLATARLVEPITVGELVGVLDAFFVPRSERAAEDVRHAG